MTDDWLEAHAGDDFCYLTTVGRRSGRPHEIEIWFAVRDGRAYLLAGGGERADWVRNLLAEPRVVLRLGTQSRPATARLVTDRREEARARQSLAAKYQGWEEPGELSEWARTALPVAIEPESTRAGSARPGEK